eukprot:5588493-Pleurochrysis_carterae.AAC.1
MISQLAEGWHLRRRIPTSQSCLILPRRVALTQANKGVPLIAAVVYCFAEATKLLYLSSAERNSGRVSVGAKACECPFAARARAHVRARAHLRVRAHKRVRTHVRMCAHVRVCSYDRLHAHGRVRGRGHVPAVRVHIACDWLLRAVEHAVAAAQCDQLDAAAAERVRK